MQISTYKIQSAKHRRAKRPQQFNYSDNGARPHPSSIVFRVRGNVWQLGISLPNISLKIVAYLPPWKDLRLKQKGFSAIERKHGIDAFCYFWYLNASPTSKLKLKCVTGNIRGV